MFSRVALIYRRFPQDPFSVVNSHDALPSVPLQRNTDPGVQSDGLSAPGGARMEDITQGEERREKIVLFCL